MTQMHEKIKRILHQMLDQVIWAVLQ